MTLLETFLFSKLVCAMDAMDAISLLTLQTNGLL